MGDEMGNVSGSGADEAGDAAAALEAAPMWGDKPAAERPLREAYQKSGDWWIDVKNACGDRITISAPVREIEAAKARIAQAAKAAPEEQEQVLGRAWPVIGPDGDMVWAVTEKVIGADGEAQLVTRDATPTEEIEAKARQRMREAAGAVAGAIDEQALRAERLSPAKAYMADDGRWYVDLIGPDLSRRRVEASPEEIGLAMDIALSDGQTGPVPVPEMSLAAAIEAINKFQIRLDGIRDLARIGAGTGPIKPLLARAVGEEIEKLQSRVRDDITDLTSIREITGTGGLFAERARDEARRDLQERAKASIDAAKKDAGVRVEGTVGPDVIGGVRTGGVGEVFNQINQHLRGDGRVEWKDLNVGLPEAYRESTMATPGLDAVADPVNNPLHYGGAGSLYETINVIEAWRLGFCLGNAVKYISRAGKKDPAKTLEDLKKARWYLDREIAMMDREDAPND